jgi:hypothetical protein
MEYLSTLSIDALRTLTDVLILIICLFLIYGGFKTTSRIKALEAFYLTLRAQVETGPQELAVFKRDTNEWLETIINSESEAAKIFRSDLSEWGTGIDARIKRLEEINEQRSEDAAETQEDSKPENEVPQGEGAGIDKPAADPLPKRKGFKRVKTKN